jgi:phage-related protein
MPLQNLTFTIAPSLTQSYRVTNKAIELGDHGTAVTIPIGRIIEEFWNVSTAYLTPTQITALETSLNTLAGQEFTWRAAVGEELFTWLCEEWSKTPINLDYAIINLKLKRSATSLIDECQGVLTAVVGAPIFPLVAFGYDSTQAVTQKAYEKRIDGGVDNAFNYSYNSSRDSWQVTRTITGAERATVLNFLRTQCGRQFEFRTGATSATGLLYCCYEWSFTHVDSGADYWVFNATMVRSLSPFKSTPTNTLLNTFDFYDNKAALKAAVEVDFGSLLGWLTDAKLFINDYTRNTLPLIMNTNGLLVNSFQNTLGRGGYFPGSAGATEGTSVASRASLYAYNITGDTGWKTIGLLCADALLNYYYTLPIPANWTSANGIRVPHWLINIKSSFISKGPITNDPLNSGRFDLVLTFVNGVATIPSGSPNFGENLANLYMVYPSTDRLLWQNVYTYPLGRFKYAIDYWVTNTMLGGVVYRQYPDTESSAGTAPTSTTETAGKIVLKDTGFNGQAKVVYSTYESAITIAAGELFEAYPMWRKLRTNEALAAFDVFPWSEDAYDLAYQITSTAKYLTAKNCTIYSENVVSQVANPSKWMERAPALNPFSFPGSQVVLANHQPGNVVTSSRVVGGAMDQWISMQIPVSSLLYSSCEFQNYAVQPIAIENATVTVQAACDQANEVQIVFSLSRDAFDFSRYYTAYMDLQAGMVPTTKTFSMDDFIFWDTGRTSWWPHVADNPVFSYLGGGGASASMIRQSMPIGLFNRYVWRIRMNPGSSYAGVGLVLIQKPVVFPLEIYYQSVAGAVTLKITVDGADYTYPLPTTTWTLAKIPNSSFSGTSGVPRSNAIITAIEFVATTSTTTDLGLWYIGFRPLNLQLPTPIYKASVTSRLTTAHTLNIGQFEMFGSPSSQLTYNPGVVPFTCNVVSDGLGGIVPDSWKGAPYAGYQYPAWYVKQGYWSRLNQVLDFLLESQEQYAAQNIYKTYSGFAPVFYWAYWDSGDLSPNGTDVWSFEGSDPNTEWCGYTSRPLESVAHAWQRMKQGEYPGVAPSNLDQLIAKAERCTMRYLWWLSSFQTKRNSKQPPTNFPPVVEPLVKYHEPQQAGFYLRAAIYANLAGGDPATTIRLIKSSLDYLKSQRITSGVMRGSFAAGQPAFSTGGGFQEYFPFWHFEIVESLALLQSKKNLLNYPDCGYLIR